MPTVLVTYGSKHGATAEIAETIAEQLETRGVSVALAEAGIVKDIARYDAVVLGSAVYMKHWRPEARRLMHRLQRDLGDRPLWMFSSGPVGEAETDPAWCEPSGVLKRAQRLNLRDHVIFGGRVPQDPRNFVERSMLKNTPSDRQDLRDFDEIRAWADAIAATLAPVTAG